MRALARALTISAALIASTIAEGNTARAAVYTGDVNCLHSDTQTVPVWAAFGCHKDVGTQQEAIATWNTNTLWTDPSKSYPPIRHMLYGWSGAPCGRYFAAIGVSRGYGAQDTYGYTWARRNNVNYFSEIPIIAGPDGSTHTYTISHQGNGTYTATISGLYSIVFAGSFGGGSCISAVGLDLTRVTGGGYTALGPWQRADTFTTTYLAWRNVNYTLITGWNTGSSYVDYPCDGTNPTTSCYNGLFYNSMTWSSNKWPIN